MATIDDRIVNIAFDNAKFEANVKVTLGTLKQLNDNLAKVGKTQGFSDVEKSSSKVSLMGPIRAIGKVNGALGGIGKWATQGFSDVDKAGSKVQLTDPITALNKVNTAVSDVGRGAPEAFGSIESSANHVDFSGLSSALDSVQGKFSVLAGAAAVALGNIYTKAAEVGANMAKELTVSPATEGFHNYETQINAVQTILANTGLKGKAGLGQVNSALKDLNNYANLTVYNFSDMAKNIGTFTAAGVDLKTATGSIKGIANLAAMSGSNSQQASTAMYQLSQAIAAGQVHLQDWNSVVNAGMGGQVFQKALMNTAVAMGTVKQSAFEVDKATGKATINGESFRQSLQTKPGQQSWLTSKVLTTTLNNFTGDVGKAKLAAEGYTKSQIATIQDQAKTAVKSATNIKTASQLFEALKEEVASSWSQVWKTLFGDINVATKLFSGLHTYIENMLRGPIDKFNKVLQDWAAIGGRQELFRGLKQAWNDLLRIIHPIQQAFRDIFPRETGDNLEALTARFVHLMDSLKASPQTMKNLRDTFDGLFAVMHIGWTIIKDVAKVFGSLLGAVGGGSGHILHFTGSIGQFLKALDDAISKGKALDGFFAGLGSAMRVPIQLLQALGRVFMGFFGGGSAAGGGVSGAQKQLDGLSKAFDRLKNSSGPVANIIKNIVNVVGAIQNRVAPIVKMIVTEINHIFETIASGIQHGSFNSLGNVITSGLLGGLILFMRKELGGGIKVQINSFGTALKGLTGVFGELTNQLKLMQKQVIASMILKIAAAIAILAAGVFVISTINPKRLASSMAAIAIGLGELVGVMMLLDRGMGAGKLTGLRMSAMATSLIILSSALVILAGAMKIMATMSWGELAKGLVGIGGGLVVIAAGIAIMNKTGGGGIGLIATGVGLMFVATAMTVLAEATKQFGSMSWGQMVKGLVGMGGALVALNIGVIGLGPELLVVGPGLLVTALAVAMLSGAVAAFSRIPLLDMVKGIIGMGAAIAMLAYEIELIPPTVAAQGAGLILLSLGLEGLAAVIATLGRMNLFTLIKGIVAMGAALVVLGAGLFALEIGGGPLGGATLLMVAAGLAILAPAIGLLGTMKISTIAKGLGAIAAALAVLAIAGLIAAAPISALGVALLPLGLFLGEIAIDVWIFAKAITMLGEHGAKGIGIFIGAVSAFIALIPHMMLGMMQGIVTTVGMVVKMLPQLTSALDKVLTIAIAFVVREAPKIGKLFGVVLDAVLQFLNKYAPKLFDAGVNLLNKFLSGLAKNIGKITTNAALVVARFLGALATHAQDIADAGGRVIVNFLAGIAKHAFKIGQKAGEIVIKFVGGIYSNAWRIADQGAHMIIKLVGALGDNMWRLINAGVHAVIKLIDGLSNAIPKIEHHGAHLAHVLVTNFVNWIVNSVDTVATGFIRLLNGLAAVIRKRSTEFWDAAANLGHAIADGITVGMEQHLPKAAKAVIWGAKQIHGAFKKATGSHSPSRLFMESGKDLMEGLAIGIDQNTHKPVHSADRSATGIVDNMRKTMGSVPKMMEDLKMSQPTITPVLDLSKVKKHAGKINDYMSVDPINVGKMSSAHASVISVQKAEVDAASAKRLAAASQPPMQFVQNNHSPEPLSTAEIYRRTNNQISQIKKKVGIHR